MSTYINKLRMVVEDITVLRDDLAYSYDKEYLVIHYKNKESSFKIKGANLDSVNGDIVHLITPIYSCYLLSLTSRKEYKTNYVYDKYYIGNFVIIRDSYTYHLILDSNLNVVEKIDFIGSISKVNKTSLNNIYSILFHTKQGNLFEKLIFDTQLGKIRKDLKDTIYLKNIAKNILCKYSSNGLYELCVNGINTGELNKRYYVLQDGRYIQTESDEIQVPLKGVYSIPLMKQIIPTNYTSIEQLFDQVFLCEDTNYYKYFIDKTGRIINNVELVRVKLISELNLMICLDKNNKYRFIILDKAIEIDINSLNRYYEYYISSDIPNIIKIKSVSGIYIYMNRDFSLAENIAFDNFSWIRV